MERAFLYSIIVASLLYVFVICAILYVEGAPIGYEGTISGGIVVDENGRLIAIPDQVIPNSAIHIEWTDEYLVEQQFRRTVDTFASTMYPFVVYIATVAGAIVAIHRALPIIRKAIETA